MPKWIHDRAEHILAKNPSMSESKAWAIATQQAHALGKSPKEYGTSEGRSEAKSKYDTPKDDTRTANPGNLNSKKVAFTTSEFSGPTGEGYRIARQASYTPPRKAPEILMKKVSAVPFKGMAIGAGLGAGSGALLATQMNPESWKGYVAPTAMGAAMGAGVGGAIEHNLVGPAKKLVEQPKLDEGWIDRLVDQVKANQQKKMEAAGVPKVAPPRTVQAGVPADVRDRIEETDNRISDVHAEFHRQLERLQSITKGVEERGRLRKELRDMASTLVIPEVAPPQVIDTTGIDVDSPAAINATIAKLRDKNYVHEF